MLSSRFALVPRGRGLHSHRLLEVLRGGCIPVLLADGYALPFQHTLDWRAFSLRFAEAELAEVVPFLRALQPQQVETLHANAATAARFLLRMTNFAEAVPIIHDRLRHRRAIRSKLVVWDEDDQPMWA